jgi:hypothetical protein
MLSQKTKRFIQVIMLFALISQIWWTVFGPGRELYEIAQDQLISPEPSWPPALVKYEIKEIDPQFQELWMISDVYIVADFGRECNLLAFQGSLFLEASFGQNKSMSLSRTHLETGEIIWQSVLNREIAGVLAHNEDAIFHGSGRRGNITAYDIETGKQIWERSLTWLGNNAVDYMHATEERLYVDSSADLDVFDVYTGQSQKWESQLDPSVMFHVDDSIIYHRATSRSIQAADRKTGRDIWEVDFHNSIRMAPVFTEKLLIVKTGRSGTGQIYVIGRSTGTILWQHPPGPIDWENPANIVGDVAEDSGYIFYLTAEAQLQSARAMTGHSAGTVQFNPSLRELDDLERVNRDFCIVANDNVVVVYFGSSRQLFAFRFSPDE